MTLNIVKAGELSNFIFILHVKIQKGSEWSEYQMFL